MHDDMHDDMKDDMPDDPEMKGMAEAKGDYLGGYYDFLINEGSYKFWAVFQVGNEQRINFKIYIYICEFFSENFSFFLCYILNAMKYL